MSWTEDEPQEPGTYMLGGAVIERQDTDSPARWAAVGWGGCRSWSAITGGVPVGTPVVRLVPATEVDKLAREVADVRDLAKANGAERDGFRKALDEALDALRRQSSPVTWRLPDKLGGAPVTSWAAVQDSTDEIEVWIGAPTDGDAVRLRIRRDALVEVRPPSIDDPVTLPTFLTDDDGSTLAIDPSPLIGRVARLNASDMLDLTAIQARDVARCLWQAANAAEEAGR